MGVCPFTGLGALGGLYRLRKGVNSTGLYGGLPLYRPGSAFENQSGLVSDSGIERVRDY